MDYELQISLQFNNDLDRVLNYLINTLYADIAAKKLIDKIEQTIATIAARFYFRYTTQALPIWIIGIQS